LTRVGALYLRNVATSKDVRSTIQVGLTMKTLTFRLR